MRKLINTENKNVLTRSREVCGECSTVKRVAHFKSVLTFVRFIKHLDLQGEIVTSFVDLDLLKQIQCDSGICDVGLNDVSSKIITILYPLVSGYVFQRKHCFIHCDLLTYFFSKCVVSFTFQGNDWLSCGKNTYNYISTNLLLKNIY